MTALRRVGFGAFVLGLGLSITLSETALTLLTLLWLWRLRDPQVRAAARWPLWQPVLAFSAVSLISAVAAEYPSLPALSACKGLLLVAALYVTADALAGPEDAYRFLSALLVVVTIVTVEVAWALNTERTIAMGITQISRKAVVTRSSVSG